MAECFRANYPDTFIVLDATELCTKIRGCLALHSQLYSSYKSRTTLKDLIGFNFPRMARSTLSVSCGVGPSAIASW